MRLSIRIDPTVDETRVDVTAAAIDDEVERIQRALADTATSRIVAYRGNDGVVLDLKDIARFYTKDKHVWVQAASGHFRIRQRMKDLEQTLPSKDFVRISQAEIINIDYVERFDVSGSASLALRLKDGTRCFVSRRSLSDFKRALGL